MIFNNFNNLSINGLQEKHDFEIRSLLREDIKVEKKRFLKHLGYDPPPHPHVGVFFLQYIFWLHKVPWKSQNTQKGGEAPTPPHTFFYFDGFPKDKQKFLKNKTINWCFVLLIFISLGLMHRSHSVEIHWGCKEISFLVIGKVCFSKT